MICLFARRNISWWDGDVPPRFFARLEGEGGGGLEASPLATTVCRDTSPLYITQHTNTSRRLGQMLVTPLQFKLKKNVINITGIQDAQRRKGKLICKRPLTRLNSERIRDEQNLRLTLNSTNLAQKTCSWLQPAWSSHGYASSRNEPPLDDRSAAHGDPSWTL